MVHGHVCHQRNWTIEVTHGFMSPLDTSKVPLQLGLPAWTISRSAPLKLKLLPLQNVWTIGLTLSWFFFFPFPFIVLIYFSNCLISVHPSLTFWICLLREKIIIKNQRTKHKMMVCLLRNEYPYSFSCSVGILSEGNLLNCCC